MRKLEEEMSLFFHCPGHVMTMPAVSKGKGGYYTGNDPDACKDIASDLSLPVLLFTELVCSFILARFP